MEIWQPILPYPLPPLRRAIAGWVAGEKKTQCTVQPLSKQGCEKSISVLSGWPDPNDAA